jgi:hypothetical protein
VAVLEGATMSAASRAYCQRRIEAIDRELAERRSYVGPIWPDERGETFGGLVFRAFSAPPPENVDALLDLRLRWVRRLAEQRP